MISKRQFLSSWKLIFGISLLGTASIAHAAEPVASAQQTVSSGWAVHYYGGPTFWYYAGTVAVPNSELALDMGKVAWPQQNWNAAKGPLFIRDGGWSWSLAAYARLRVEKEGEYRFAIEPDKNKPSNVLLQVNGRILDEAVLQKPLKLPVGGIPLSVYVKPTEDSSSSPKVKILWQAPGTDRLSPLPEGVLTHDAGDMKKVQVCPVDFPLNYDMGEVFRHAQRRFTVDLPESGFYEIATHFGSMPRLFKVWMDASPLLYVQGDRREVKDPLYLATDRAGVTDFQRLDFFHRSRTVRFLSKGRHTVDIYSHYNHLIWEDEMRESMKNFKIGLTRIGEADPARSLSVYPKGREDMILKRYEPLTICISQATLEPVSYTMEVLEERGDGKVIWSKKLDLSGGKAQVSNEFEYPCDKEGVFEYTVRDEAGKAVDGPWSFVVVDPTTLKRPRNTNGKNGSGYRKELVDAVDCTLPSDKAHVFRDNGTSQVVDSGIGRYRVTGTSPMRSFGYVKDGDSWRRVKEGEKGKVSYTGADWFAYTLKVKNPGRPYLVVGQVPNDIKRLVSMYATDQVTGHYNGWNLDAGDAPESGPFSPLSLVIWPNGKAIDVMVVCSNGNHGHPNNRQGAMAKIELYELPDGLPFLPEAAGGWSKDKEFGWNGEQINLGVVERTTPSLWEGNDPVSGVVPRFSEGGFRDWKALHTAWDRFGQFSAYRGDNICIFPVQSYGMNFLQGEPELMLPKCWDIYSKGYRARVIDPMERDIFKLMLLTAQKYGVRLVADFMVHRLEEIFPVLSKQSGVPVDGIFLTDDASGKPWRAFSGAFGLNPAHPVVRKYMVELMDAMGHQYGEYPAFAGVRTRQWAFWPSELDCWFFNDKLGFDDFTVDLFCKETGCKLSPASGNEAAFKERREKLLSEYREEWLSWRCQKVLSLREEMLKALRKYSPGARLFSDGLFNREGGLDPELLASRKEIGWGMSVGKFGGDESVGIEWNYPDPVEFVNFDQREPESLHRTLKNLVPHGHTYPQGMNCNQAYRSHPYQLEGPAMALAEGKLDSCIYGGQWCLPPADEGLRMFVQAWRAIPDLKYTRFPVEEGENGRIACWYSQNGTDLIFYLVNRTDKPIEAEVSFTSMGNGSVDLVSGQESPSSRTLRTMIAPFMPKIVKAGNISQIDNVSVPFSKEEEAGLRRSFDGLRAIQTLAKGVAETLHGSGERYTSEAEDIGKWSRYDSDISFDDLFNPVNKAWQAKKLPELARLMNDFKKNHLWWYEVFGWPDDFYVPLKAVDFRNGQSAAGKELLDRYKTAAKTSQNEPNKSFTQISGNEGDFLTASKGESMTFRFNPEAGTYELRVWGIFGGDYNPIKVSFKGIPVGEINIVGKKERHVHQVLSVPLKFAWSPQDITLVGKGEKGLAVSRIEVRALPPSPIRNWQVIGLFDKKEVSGIETVFLHEGKIDVSKSYSGSDGKPIRWKALDLGKEKIIQLRKLFATDARKVKNVAYLSAWLRTQNSSSLDSYSLIYSVDGDSEIWLNGKLVVPKASGRCGNFKKQKINLQRGWNCLLVKTSPGTEGWNAVVAVNDAGDLEFSGIPPEEKTK